MDPRIPTAPTEMPPGDPPSGGPPPRAEFVLAVAPGPRTQGLGELLGVLLRQLQATESDPPAKPGQPRGLDGSGSTPGSTPGSQGVRAEVRELEDLIQLLPGRGAVVSGPGEVPNCGRLVLDGEHLPLEDVGLVRRFLVSNPGWSAVCLGLDPRGTVQGSLEGLPRIGWRPWPPDLDQLRALARIPDPLPILYGADGSAVAAPTDLSGPQARELIEIVRRLESRVLAAPADRVPAHSAPGDLALRSEVVRLGLLCRELGVAPSTSIAHDGIRSTSDSDAPSESRPSLSPTGSWDEGDMSFEEVPDRRGEGTASFASAPDTANTPRHPGVPGGPGEKDPPAGTALGPRELIPGDARPPHPKGAPTPVPSPPVDLAALLEERLASLAVRLPDGPRFQFAGDPCLWVEGSADSLATTIEDLLEIARQCAGSEGVVRVRAGHRDTRSGRQVDALMSFPLGPLEGLDRARILTPGGLRDALPSIGARDFGRAALGIRAQGGALGVQIDRGGRIRVAFRLRAAAVDPDDAVGSSSGARASGTRGTATA